MQCGHSGKEIIQGIPRRKARDWSRNQLTLLIISTYSIHSLSRLLVCNGLNYLFYQTSIVTIILNTQVAIISNTTILLLSITKN